jgi:hypothetical protein
MKKNFALLLVLVMVGCGSEIPMDPEADDAGVVCIEGEQCLIDGKCWNAWELNPENECESCNLLYRDDRWYGRINTPCSGGTKVCHQVSMSHSVCE